MNKKNNILDTIISIPEMGVVIPLIILVIVVGIVNPNFLKFGNMIDIFRSCSYSFIIAAPITLLFISGGMDLSIAAATALGCVVCAWGLTSLHLGILLSAVLALICGGIVGLVKAILCVKYDLPPFIVTLGVAKIVTSIILVTTDGIAISGITNESFKVLGQGKIGPIYWTIIISIVIGIIMHIMLTKTKFGRQIAACGGNQETAKLAGINVVKTRFATHIMVSVFSALAGVLMCSRFYSGQTSAGNGTEMTIMAAVIMGGTSMAGGTGSIIGSFLGCLLIAAINNGLVLMKVSTNWQNMIFGIILIISLIIDKYRREKNSGGL